jgi:hypothetical protein
MLSRQFASHAMSSVSLPILALGNTHKLVLVLDSQGSSRECWGNIDFLNILGNVTVNLLPFVDKWSAGRVFW